MSVPINNWHVLRPIKGAINTFFRTFCWTFYLLARQLATVENILSKNKIVISRNFKISSKGYSFTGIWVNKKNMVRISIVCFIFPFVCDKKGCNEISTRNRVGEIHNWTMLSLIYYRIILSGEWTWLQSRSGEIWAKDKITRGSDGGA